MKTLQDFLRAATLGEREQLAAQAGTSVAYLYQLAGGHRRNPSASLAVGIERGTAALNALHPDRLPVVTVDALAAGAGVNDFDPVVGG